MHICSLWVQNKNNEHNENIITLNVNIKERNIIKVVNANFEKDEWNEYKFIFKWWGKGCMWDDSNSDLITKLLKQWISGKRSKLANEEISDFKIAQKMKPMTVWMNEWIDQWKYDIVKSNGLAEWVNM